MSNVVAERPVHWLNNRLFFFKYMTRSTATIVLERQTLRWSTPGTLNDPYDMQFDLQVDIDRNAVKAATLQKEWDALYGDRPTPVGNVYGELTRAIKEIFPKMTRDQFDQEMGRGVEDALATMDRTLPELMAGARALIRKCKILCLTETPDNPTMWTHYGENHQGVVLRFKSIPELDSSWGAAQPVQYLPDMPLLFDDDFLSDLLSGRVSLDIRSIKDRLVFTKSSEWASEREWRIFSGTGRNTEAPHEDLPFHELELDAVIFGCNAPDEDKTAISSLVQERYPHVEILQTEKAVGAFRLEIRPLAA